MMVDSSNVMDSDDYLGVIELKHFSLKLEALFVALGKEGSMLAANSK